MRERKRVAWILLLLALLFAACWLPHSILTLLSDAEVIRKDNIFIPYSRLLGHTNSAINPIIYCFMTRNFRRSVKELLWRSRAGLTASSRRSNRCQVGCIYHHLRWTEKNDPKISPNQRNPISRPIRIDTEKKCKFYIPGFVYNASGANKYLYR